MKIDRFITMLNQSQYNDVPPAVMHVYQTVEGFSKPKLMNVLNMAVSCMEPEEIYYEIGTHQGKTLIGAIIDHDCEAIAVDNFSQFDSDGLIQGILFENMDKHGVTSRVHFFNDDYRGMDETDIFAPVGVFFYDGNHDSPITFDALERTVPFLADNALILLDDISGAPVHGPGCWGGVLDFLRNHLDECAPIFIMYTNNFPYPDSDWHNGIVAIQWRKHGTDALDAQRK
jgi:hypothetical protein